MPHILIVDDEPAIRDAVRAILERDGHTVAEEPDGHALSAAVAERRPDVVILDMHMPGPKSGETIAALRRDHPSLKILAISGDTVLDAAQRQGADAVLAKPFRSAELRDAIAALLKS